MFSRGGIYKSVVELLLPCTFNNPLVVVVVDAGAGGVTFSTGGVDGVRGYFGMYVGLTRNSGVVGTGVGVRSKSACVCACACARLTCFVFDVRVCILLFYFSFVFVIVFVLIIHRINLD